MHVGQFELGKMLILRVMGQEQPAVWLVVFELVQGSSFLSALMTIGSVEVSR